MTDMEQVAIKEALQRIAAALEKIANEMIRETR